MLVSNEISVGELIEEIGKKYGITGAKIVYLGRFLQEGEKSLREEMVEDKSEIYVVPIIPSRSEEQEEKILLAPKAYNKVSVFTEMDSFRSEANKGE